MVASEETRTLSAGTALAALLHGLKLSMKDGQLRGRIMVAILVNALLFGLLIYGIVMVSFGAVDTLMAIDTSGFSGIGFLPDVVNDWVLGVIPAVISAIGGLLKVVVGVVTLMASPLLFRLLAVSILPIYQEGVFLSARAHAGGGEPPNASPGLVRTIWIEIRRFSVFGVLSLLLLPLNLVPVIGTVVYGVAQGLLAAQTLGWDLLSHHFEIHGMSLEEQRTWVRTHRGVVLAFGGASLALCMVPVLQILFITTNVAGAGVLSAWIEQAEGTPQRLLESDEDEPVQSDEGAGSGGEG
ncbi:MAG: EI24 domain-containing protein [Myxococcota bacterium]|nr:EI24 domain-containing protein [Myxococcota bacterium]